MCGEVTWLENRVLRFHEIVCIREVKKTKCYFLKSCDPFSDDVSMGRTDSKPQGCKS